MKRFSALLLVGTLMALGYVHQHVLLIDAGYEVEHLRLEKDDLMDRYRVLHYNVFMLRSPVILEKRLASAEIQLAPPMQVLALRGQSAQVAPEPEIVGEGPWFQPVLQFASRWLPVAGEAIASEAIAEPGPSLYHFGTGHVAEEDAFIR